MLRPPFNCTIQELLGSHGHEFEIAGPVGVAEMEQLSSAIAAGALSNLKGLYLNSNKIGDAGMIAFIDAIKPTP